jgi:hypothetical protein
MPKKNTRLPEQVSTVEIAICSLSGAIGTIDIDDFELKIG